MAHILPTLELLEEMHQVYEQVDHNFATLPKALKERIEAKKGRSLLDDLTISLMFVDPEERRARRDQLAALMESLRQQVDDDRIHPDDGSAGPLFEPDDMVLVREFLHLLTVTQGSRNRREMLRFFEAVRSNDVAFLVLKYQPPQSNKKNPQLIDARFAHHLPMEIGRELRLTTPQPDESVS